MKRITWIIMGWLVLLTAAQAADESAAKSVEAPKVSILQNAEESAKQAAEEAREATRKAAEAAKLALDKAESAISEASQ
ncbi:MAG TPA: hypothetical protein VKG67_01710, partial [Gallionellaceae bacterium]|nr:hypothetical protein [Gallionellaceae bacterium]